METILKLASETPSGAELIKEARKWPGLGQVWKGLSGQSLGSALGKAKSLLTFQKSRDLAKIRGQAMAGATVTPEQIASELGPKGLGAKQLARLMGKSPATVKGYAKGTRKGIARAGLPGAAMYAGAGAGVGGAGYATTRTASEEVHGICKEAMDAANETFEIL